jgi:8-oxo-dGTP pyrophosphatase MutT (NUDIX family)
MLEIPPLLAAGEVLPHMVSERVDDWRVSPKPISVATYRRRLRERITDHAALKTQLGRVSAFAHGAEIVEVNGPDGLDGFRAIHNGVMYVTGLAVAYNEVYVVGESRFGIRHHDNYPAITIGPATGVPRRNESAADCIRRETEEETGLKVREVTQLIDFPSPICGARHNIRCLAFLVYLETPLQPANRRPDRGEIVRACRMGFPEWQRLMKYGYLVEETAAITTLHALPYLRKLHMSFGRRARVR